MFLCGGANFQPKFSGLLVCACESLQERAFFFRGKFVEALSKKKEKELFQLLVEHVQFSDYHPQNNKERDLEAIVVQLCNQQAVGNNRVVCDKEIRTHRVL